MSMSSPVCAPLVEYTPRTQNLRYLYCSDQTGHVGSWLSRSVAQFFVHSVDGVKHRTLALLSFGVELHKTEQKIIAEFCIIPLIPRRKTWVLLTVKKSLKSVNRSQRYCKNTGSPVLWTWCTATLQTPIHGSRNSLYLDHKSECQEKSTPKSADDHKDLFSNDISCHFLVSVGVFSATNMLMQPRPVCRLPFNVFLRDVPQNSVRHYIASIRGI